MSKGKKQVKRITAVTLISALSMSMTGFGAGDSALDPKNPVTITVWNYYNGDQLIAFDEMVDTFNATTGIEKGIVVVTVSQGDINTLADSLLDSVAKKAGAQDCPNLAAVYAETAYILNEEGALAPMDNYFTEEELSAFVPGFLEEGRFNENNELLIFPIIKSTEMFTANETDWAPFAADTGITLDSLKTKEDLTAAAQSYYEWTDALTPDVPEDGKALYGRDSTANYLYLGCYQLGQDMFPVQDGQLTVNMDRDTFKTLWDNYYIPYINGYFGSYGKFRSEDAKTGQILSLTSSSASVSYLPSNVTLEDDSTHAITIYITKDLPFADAAIDAVMQQGASYCMLTASPAEEEASAEFLKWATAPEQNLTFALKSGYSPVTLAANNTDAITNAYEGDTATEGGKNVLNTLITSADAFTNNTAYATKPFKGSKEVRGYLGDALDTICASDRAAVVSAIEAGSTREEATAPYCTDEYFDTWFNQVCSQVTALMK